MTHNIAQANAPVSDKWYSISMIRLLKARFEGDFPIVGKKYRVTSYMDVAPNQIVSVAASMNSILGA